MTEIANVSEKKATERMTAATQTEKNFNEIYLLSFGIV